MALVRVDGVGVGEYDANNGKIEAEDYFKASGISKKEIPNGGFAIGDIGNNDLLVYPNVKGLSGKSTIEFHVARNKPTTIEIHKDSPEGELMASCQVKAAKSATGFESIRCDLPKMDDTQSLCFVFKGKRKNSLKLDSFLFK